MESVHAYDETKDCCPEWILRLLLSESLWSTPRVASPEAPTRAHLNCRERRFHSTLRGSEGLGFVGHKCKYCRQKYKRHWNYCKNMKVHTRRKPSVLILNKLAHHKLMIYFLDCYPEICALVINTVFWQDVCEWKYELWKIQGSMVVLMFWVTFRGKLA